MNNLQLYYHIMFKLLIIFESFRFSKICFTCHYTCIVFHVMRQLFGSHIIYALVVSH